MYAPCDIQVLDPIVTVEILSIQTFSPIQTSSPIINFHGYLILTFGLMRIFFPILDPNNFKRKTLILFPGIAELKNKALITYHKKYFNKKVL
jgi:hypothetical protein